MAELQLKNRHHLRKKEAKKVKFELEEQFGMALSILKKGHIELAEAEEHQLIIVNNEVIGFYFESRPFLTIKGFLALGDELNNLKKFVTVDSGAVKFVSNGADIMVPGIVDTEESISAGDLVWIREEKHLKPLAVGQALMNAIEIKIATGGKAIKTLHYVGDTLWGLEL